ncbi:MAG: DnaD domain protein [Anaerolineaceae bacterium]|jgi:DnaD/phage-associated family protein
MTPFAGFPEGKSRQISLPAQFFSELLPQIDDLGELKVTLYAFWYLSQQEGTARYFTLPDLLADELFSTSFGKDGEAQKAALQDALGRGVQRGTLLTGKTASDENIYFLNTPRGRAARHALELGKWSPDGEQRAPAALDAERPNIFRLYEENIGPLTPMIADDLRLAEQEYPAGWIEDAIRVAVQANKRSWRYVESILRRRKEKGANEPDRPGSQEDLYRYTKGKYGDIVKH